jgi:hypothetical protein
MAPISALSADLLRMVLLRVVDDVVQVAHWVHLTEVCRVWHVVMTDGAFWGRISTSNPGIVSHLLVLSRCSQLEVTLYIDRKDPPSRMAQMVALVAPHMARTRTLDLRLGGLKKEGLPHIEKLLGSDIHTLHALKTLRLSCGSFRDESPMPYVKQALPRLQCFRLVGRMQWDHPLISHTLRVLHVADHDITGSTFAIQDVYAALRGVPALEELVIQQNRPFQTSVAPLQGVQLRRLRHLEIRLPIESLSLFCTHLEPAERANMRFAAQLQAKRLTETAASCEALCLALSLYAQRAHTADAFNQLEVFPMGQTLFKLALCAATCDFVLGDVLQPRFEMVLYSPAHINKFDNVLIEFRPLWRSLFLQSFFFHGLGDEHATSFRWNAFLGEETHAVALCFRETTASALLAFLDACAVDGDSVPSLEQLIVDVSFLEHDRFAEVMVRMAAVFGRKRRALARLYLERYTADATRIDCNISSLANCAETLLILGKHCRLSWDIHDVASDRL